LNLGIIVLLLGRKALNFKFMAISMLNIRQKLNKEITTLLNHTAVGDREFLVWKDLNYDDFLSDRILIIRVIRAGIPFTLFDLIQQDAPFSDDEWAEFLGLSLKSLDQYRRSSKSFNSVQSEKIIQIAEVTKTGLEVFEDMGKFKLWLNKPADALGNLKPRELLRYSYGKEQIISELTKISEGSWA
jgi:putative toxin-antitoxin system antitoxin component (TIGR02293 family)